MSVTILNKQLSLQWSISCVQDGLDWAKNHELGHYLALKVKTLGKQKSSLLV